MAISQSFKDFVVEVFEPFGSVRVRAMFGGAGIFAGDTMFGLIGDERIYLKTDATTRPDFVAEASEEFVFEMKNGERIGSGYFEMPAFLFDDSDALKVWARRALDIAMRGKAKRAPKSRRAPAKKPKR